MIFIYLLFSGFLDFFKMDHYQFVTQAYPNFDPAAHAMYYHDMATAPPPPPQQHQPHAADGRISAYSQFNFQVSPGHANPQHEQHARRIHHLQQQQQEQHAAFQQQQVMYHQQSMYLFPDFDH